MMKKITEIISLVLIIISFSILLWNLTRKKGKSISDIENDHENENADLNNQQTFNTVRDSEISYATINTIKDSSVDSIATRHRDASKIMRDSVEEIYKNAQAPTLKNSEIEDISESLKELLQQN